MASLLIIFFYIFDLMNSFIYTEDPDLPPVLREKPFTITWLPNPGNHNWCMNEWGETTRMEVNFEQANPKRYQPEMICTYIGYVEEKGTTSDGDVCYSDTSAWALDYVVDSEDDSRLGEHAYAWGSFEWLESITRKSNEMYVKSPEFPKRPENISMSTSEEYRVGSRTEWPLGTQGPLWVCYPIPLYLPVT